MVMMPSTAAARIAVALPWSILDARRDDHSRHATSVIIPLSIAMPTTATV